MYNVSKCLLRTSNFIIERRKEKNFIAACESLFSMIWRLVNVTMDKYFEIYICACCIVCVVKWNCSQTFAPNCQFNCNCCTNMIYTFFLSNKPNQAYQLRFYQFLRYMKLFNKDGKWNFLDHFRSFASLRLFLLRMMILRENRKYK